MSGKPLKLIEIDRRLSEDPTGTELKRLVERLEAGKARVVQAMNRGASQTEYARLSSLSLAYDCGIDALPKLWASINEDQSQPLSQE